jgi:hypothetical protein
MCYEPWHIPCTNSRVSNPFREILFDGATEGDLAWLQRTWPVTAAAVSLTSLRASFAAVGRRFNGVPLRLQDVRRLEQQTGVAAVARGWDLAAVGRVALLVRALEVVPRDEQVPFVRQVYLRGDFHEQVAVLRSLIFLPEPARFTDLAIEACRTNVLDVFAAIACENPFGARYMPEPNFNQMVLKAIFMGLDTHRIIGLKTRATTDLKRMVADFASERRAAGRVVPPDTEYILAIEGRAQ